MTYSDIFQKIKKFILARPVTGGLEINDTSLRFMEIENGGLVTAMIRLAPGVMNAGKIENQEEFISSLKELRSQILGAKSKRRMPVNVVVSLSSVNIYTQVFSLPAMEGESLEKAIQLNIQMASPSGSPSETYAGWQALPSQKEDDSRLDVVTAFLSRPLADDLIASLRRGGFMPVSLESRALSLARLIKERASGAGASQSLVAVSADATGLDVMIVRAGHLHFDYFNSWKDLQGEARQIPVELFRTLVVRSLNRVMNYYGAHWKDPVSEIVVATTGMKDEILGAIRENFEIKVSELTPAISPSVGPEWFVALGSALRGLLPRRQDKEISLVGVSAQEEFQREEVRNFLDFWRILVPAALAVLFLAFVGGWFFLNNLQNGLVPQKAASQTPLPIEIKELGLQAEHLNASVAMMQSINSAEEPKSKIFATLIEIVNRRAIKVNRIQIGSRSAPVVLEGRASSQEDIIALKNELSATPGFKNVQLPLTSIRQNPNDYSFSVSFIVAP